MDADAAFLAEVTGFLDAAVAAGTGHATPTTGDEALLLDSHQLLAETEELLASCNTPKAKVASQKSQISAEERREIRNAQAAKRRLRYRQKLKDEKEILFLQESELSGELSKLQAAEAEKKRKQAGNLALGAWKAVAARQLERRMEAEQLQKQLRTQVVGRSRFIHQLNVMLQERLQHNQWGRLVSWETMKTSRADDGAALFKGFLSDIDALYAQTDKVLSGLEFKSPFPISSNLTRRWDQGVLYFDSSDKMEFPYEFEQAADAISVVMMSDPETGFETVKANDVKDTISMKYQLKYQLSREHTASFAIYGTAKRYQERGRVVYVWRSLTEGQGEFEGLQSDETTWMVVRPSASSSGQSSTVLESYARLVPVRMGPSDENVDRFVKILAKSGEEESKEMTRMMEKLMLSVP
ncbi:hypothetical protein PRNP1_012827 [Phytophthora ramorum]